jgi:hypothetical protein
LPKTFAFVYLPRTIADRIIPKAPPLTPIGETAQKERSRDGYIGKVEMAADTDAGRVAFNRTMPRLRTNPDTALDLADEKRDLLARAIREGDPLADAVIKELDALGPEGGRVLDAGLRSGLASLDAAPPAIEALLRATEAVPDWVDSGIMDGLDAILSVEPLWSSIVTGIGSLLHTYASPAIARVLAGTGRLATMAPRRLMETNRWASSAVLPGGLARGADGYVATIQVRLLHARVRATNLKRGWDVETWGVPISQVDMARTWFDFNLWPYQALQNLGFDFSEAEIRDLYAFWRYVAYLLGIDPAFYLDVHDHAQAEELLDAIDTTNGPPDDNSRALVAALIDATAGELMAALNTPPTLTADIAHALARFINGDLLADNLGIRRTEMSYLIPLMIHDNQSARQLQRIVPGAWEQQIRQNVALLRASLEGPSPATPYQTYFGTSVRSRSSA